MKFLPKVKKISQASQKKKKTTNPMHFRIMCFFKQDIILGKNKATTNVIKLYMYK